MSVIRINCNLSVIWFLNALHLCANFTKHTRFSANNPPSREGHVFHIVQFASKNKSRFKIVYSNHIFSKVFICIFFLFCHYTTVLPTVCMKIARIIFTTVTLIEKIVSNLKNVCSIYGEVLMSATIFFAGGWCSHFIFKLHRV